VNRLHILGLISIFACVRVIPGSLGKQGSSKLLRRREISHICVSGMRRKSKPHNDLLEPDGTVGVARDHSANENIRLGLHGRHRLDCFRSGRGTGNQRQTDLHQQAALGPVVSRNGASVEAHGPFGDG